MQPPVGIMSESGVTNVRGSDWTARGAASPPVPPSSCDIVGLYASLYVHIDVYLFACNSVTSVQL